MSNEAQKTIVSAKMDALYDAIEKAMPDEARKADVLARQRKIHYDASIRKGFTADQAIILCTQTTFS
tara:strand:+ start:200 stop:400 length:201 start_codon:yes stop_codon:yes gene_type:complete